MVATERGPRFFNDQLGLPGSDPARKGYSLTMPRPAICPAHPFDLPRGRVAVTPFQWGYRLGSTMEFAGYDTSSIPDRLLLQRRRGLTRGAGVRAGAGAVVRLAADDLDGLPIIDRSPRWTT